MKIRKYLLYSSGLCALLLLLLMVGGKIFFDPHLGDVISSSPLDIFDNFFWAAEPLLLSIFFFILASYAQKAFFEYSCIILASFLMAGFIAELYYGINSTRGYYGKYVPSAREVPDKIYPITKNLYFDQTAGYTRYKPEPVTLASSRVDDTGKKLYDVLYTLNKDGFRVTPERGAAADTAVLLFGCSFTFGEGVEDKETYAYKLGELLGERYQVYNFAHRGYGAHQMLAQIESGILPPLCARYKHIFAFFLTIANHPDRCTGFINYSTVAPKYILENGKITRDGLLTGSNTIKIYDIIFRNSALYTKKIKPLIQDVRFSDTIALHTAIIAESAKQMQQRCRADFTVLVWPDFLEEIDRLKAHSLPVLSLAQAMPDWENTHLRYELGKRDGHPNALAHDIIAHELFEYLRKKSTDRACALQ